MFGKRIRSPKLEFLSQGFEKFAPKHDNDSRDRKSYDAAFAGDKNCFFFHAYRVPIRDTDELRSCGSVATRLNFSRAWWTMWLISGEKDWKHVSVQKVVTLNICCNVACLTFHLPHITTGSFQSHQCSHTTGSFQIRQRLEECNMPSVRWKRCAFYKVVWWHISGVVGKGVTVCFLLR